MTASNDDATNNWRTPLSAAALVIGLALLALSLVATAGLVAQGCGDKGGYRGGKKSKARLWLDEHDWLYRLRRTEWA